MYLIPSKIKHVFFSSLHLLNCRAPVPWWLCFSKEHESLTGIACPCLWHILLSDKKVSVIISVINCVKWIKLLIGEAILEVLFIFTPPITVCYCFLAAPRNASHKQGPLCWLLCVWISALVYSSILHHISVLLLSVLVKCLGIVAVWTFPELTSPMK